METKLIKSLVGLGVPGVSLGIFYLLLRSLNFEFSTVGPVWTAAVVITFLLVVGGVTIFALHRWSPEQKQREPAAAKEDETTDEDSRTFTFRVGEEEVNFIVKMKSLHADVVKVMAHTHQIGVAAEYRWINNEYPDSQRLRQAIMSKDLPDGDGGRKEVFFDVVTIRLEDGREKDIHFDISEFVAPGMASSMSTPDAFMESKLESLYT
jgi:hypothetical protein